MGDKRKIRTPKVRESFFKPMNILGLNGNSINALTYSTITHFQETKFNLKIKKSYFNNTIDKMISKQKQKQRIYHKLFLPLWENTKWQKYPFAFACLRFDMKKCLPLELPLLMSIL